MVKRSPTSVRVASVSSSFSSGELISDSSPPSPPAAQAAPAPVGSPAEVCTLVKAGLLENELAATECEYYCGGHGHLIDLPPLARLRLRCSRMLPQWAELGSTRGLCSRRSCSQQSALMATSLTPTISSTSSKLSRGTRESMAATCGNLFGQGAGPSETKRLGSPPPIFPKMACVLAAVLCVAIGRR